MNRKFYILLCLLTLMAFSFNTAIAQQQGGSIVLTHFGDSTYTTGMAGEFQDIEFEQGQTVNIKGMYGDLATATEVNINYTIFASDWSGIVYTDVQVFANDSIGNLDGVIDFDYIIPMDADTAGQHDIDTATVAFDFIQCRVWHEESAELDVFWYEFVNVRPKSVTSTFDFQKLEGLEVFPNPADDLITIRTPEEGDKNVMIYDAAGRRVMNMDMTSDRIDVSSLQSGFHTIRVEQDGKIGILKLMIE